MKTVKLFANTINYVCTTGDRRPARLAAAVASTRCRSRYFSCQRCTESKCDKFLQIPTKSKTQKKKSQKFHHKSCHTPKSAQKLFNVTVALLLLLRSTRQPLEVHWKTCCRTLTVRGTLVSYFVLTINQNAYIFTCRRACGE